MRCRTSGSSANRTISWISFLPPSSAGWRLAGDDELDRPLGVRAAARLSRSGSRSIRVSRLYDGTRRAKPIVSTSGSSDVVDPAELGRRLAPRLSHDGAQPAAGVVRPAGSRSSPLGRPDRRRRRPGRRASQRVGAVDVGGRADVLARPSSKTSRPTQVGACTPLVIEVIGTSASSKPGHRPANISRLTSPCSWRDAVGALGRAAGP